MYYRLLILIAGIAACVSQTEIGPDPFAVRVYNCREFQKGVRVSPYKRLVQRINSSCDLDASMFGSDMTQEQSEAHHHRKLFKLGLSIRKYDANLYECSF